MNIIGVLVGDGLRDNNRGYEEYFLEDIVGLDFECGCGCIIKFSCLNLLVRYWSYWVLMKLFKENKRKVKFLILDILNIEICEFLVFL